MDYVEKSTSIIPELLGPVFKNENINFRQALCNNNTNQRFQLLATFVPDELIYLIDQKARLVDYHFSILLFLDLSALYSLFDEFCNAANNGSSGLSMIFNRYTSAIIEQVSFNGGDIIQFTDNGILSMWKQNANELTHILMRQVISCSFAIKEAVKNLENDLFDLSQAPIKSAISAGSVTFSVIGDGDVQSFVINGEPVTAVRKAIKVSDLILTESAWEHCVLSDYVYIIQDKSHIKIIKELKKYESSETLMPEKRRLEIICKRDTDVTKSVTSISSSKDSNLLNSKLSSNKMKNPKCVAIVQNHVIERHIVHSRRTVLDACKSQLGIALKKFVVKPVLNQIESDRPLEHLTEMRNVTIVLIEVSFINCTESQLISLTNKCHAIISASCENVGCIEDASLRDSSAVFRIVFGIHSYLKNSNHCRFGILCTRKLLRSLKRLTHVDGVSVGVSTGITCCMVAGHAARHHYAIIGPPTTKAKNMMYISHNKVTCDLDTLVYSGIEKSNFQVSGLINLRGYEKGYVFEFLDENVIKNPDANDLKDAYPILSRFQELELFGEILDNIGLPNRPYAGMLIEGDCRIGKSRLLDAFVTIARARQIMVVKLVLRSSFAGKPYAIIYKILRKILEAEDCKTMDEFEKNITENLGHTIPSNDLCYLNNILRVRFKLSKQYILDSDWDRHRKSLIIFDKILKIYAENKCILLDNVQFMDYMSWRFLTRAINHKNVVLGMTILEIQSWDELSRVENDICRDKRLLRHNLADLNKESLACLVCQFLSVQGISTELQNFIENSGKFHPGWYEVFLTLIILYSGLDLVTLSPKEAAKHSLHFPEPLLTNRIPADLLPDEVAPHLPWNKRKSIPVCLTNENFRVAHSFVAFDIRGLVVEVYQKLSTYEQDMVRCAAILGKVFARSMLEMIIPNHESLKTSSAIENMIRVRIFECAALQRRSTKVGDLAVCSFEPRSTFSDMHHLLRCRCHLRYIPPEEKHLSRYAHCRLMEFKVSTFQRVVYEQMISENEKKEFHAQVVEIYKKDARKCTACGGGPFLRIPGKEKSKRVTHSPLPINASSRVEPVIENRSIKTYSMGSENGDVEEIVHEIRDNDITGISIMRTSFETDETQDFQNIFIVSKKPKSARKRYWNTRVHPIMYEDANPAIHLNNFGHIDFRNCRCISVIDCIFLKLQQHIQHIDNNHKIIQFMMEYSAALIDYGQPGYALRFLAKADERNDYINTYDQSKSPALYWKTIRKGIILCLRGNAFMLLGNYPQAKTNYIDALSLYKHNFSTSELLSCYKAMYAEIKQNIRWTFTYPTVSNDTRHERATIIRQNAATSLRLVSTILMINNQRKSAKLASLQSIILGFASYDPSSFYDQCQLYLSIVKVYGQLGDLAFLSHVEKYMLFAVNQKLKWNNINDIVMLTYVYSSVFKVSLLRGKLERAVQFGEKALRIAKTFHMIRLEFELLPSLIHVLMRLKRVCETVDMLQQLRDISQQDVDKSALTWYYALCMDLLLDTGILIESYEACAAYAQKILVGKSDASIARDSKCLRRLVAGLWSWQLLRGDLTSTAFVLSLDFFTTDLEADDYSQIVTLCKIFECHLLLLTRCINMRKGSQMELLLVDIRLLMKLLDDIVKITECIKPHYYMLKAYYSLLRGRTLTSNSYLRMAKKSAEFSGNLLALAWIRRNKITWKAVSYNNMACYWEENIGYRNTIVWQDVDMFDLNDWSNLLYSLPIPDSYI